MKWVILTLGALLGSTTMNSCEKQEIKPKRSVTNVKTGQSDPPEHTNGGVEKPNGG